MKLSARIMRRLDRAYLRLTNPFRPIKLGYVEKVGTIHWNGKNFTFCGWECDGLGSATGITINSDGMLSHINGWPTGLIHPPKP